MGGPGTIPVKTRRKNNRYSHKHMHIIHIPIGMNGVVIGGSICGTGCVGGASANR